MKVCIWNAEKGFVVLMRVIPCPLIWLALLLVLLCQQQGCPELQFAQAVAWDWLPCLVSFLYGPFSELVH